MTQAELDQECGFSLRIVDKLERMTVDRRSRRPTDPSIEVVFETLDRLEASGRKGRGVERVRPHVKRVPPSRTRDRSKSSTTQAKQVIKTKQCPDLRLWLTQRGCDGIRQKNQTCLSLRGGKGCRGVDSRKGLDVKTIEANDVGK